MKLGLSLFAKEAALFAFVMAAGLFTAFRYSFYLGDFMQGGTIKFTLTDAVVLIILLGSLFFVSRYKKIARFLFKLLLTLLIFSGTQAMLGAVVPSPWDMAAAFLITLLFLGGNVLFHNLGIILGVGGIAAVFGLSVPVELGLILLVVFSLYDIIAVYVTKHMVALARGMVESGAVFGFLIPFEFKGFFYGKNEAKAGIGNNFMILGSGDFGLPLVFVSSLVRVSLGSAIITAAFSLIGLFITHILFLNQTERRAMAALPPIATMTIIGYLISLWA